MNKLNRKSVILLLIGIPVAAFLSLFGTIVQIYTFLPAIFLASSIEPFAAPLVSVFAVSSLGFAYGPLTYEALDSIFIAVFCGASLTGIYFFVMGNSKWALYASAIFLGSALSLGITWDQIFLLLVLVSAILLDKRGNLRGFIQLGTVSVLVFIPFSLGLILRASVSSIFGTSLFDFSTNFALVLSGHVAGGSSILAYSTIPNLMFYCFFVFLVLAFLAYRVSKIRQGSNIDLFAKLREKRLTLFVILVLTFNSLDILFASGPFAFGREAVYETVAILAMMAFLKRESFPSLKETDGWFSNDLLLVLGLFLYIANLPYWHLVLPLELSGALPSQVVPQFTALAQITGALLIIASISCTVTLMPAIIIGLTSSHRTQERTPPEAPRLSIVLSPHNIDSQAQFLYEQSGKAREELEPPTKNEEIDVSAKNDKRQSVDPAIYSLAQKARASRKTSDLIQLLWENSKIETGKDSSTLTEILDRLASSGKLRVDTANDLKVQLNAFAYSKSKQDRIPFQLFNRCLDAVTGE